MLTLAESFSLILTGLRATIAQIAFKQRDRTAFLVFVHGRIGRTIQRFQQLYARWQNGSLPKRRIRAPRATNARAPNPAQFRLPQFRLPQFRLPRGRAWLRRQLQHYEANGRASQLRHLLATAPDLAEFLEAAPQARRLLRPVCQMLGVTLSVTPGIERPATPPAKPATPPTPAPPPCRVERPSQSIPTAAPPKPMSVFSPA